MQQFYTHAVHDRKCHVRTVLRRIDMYAERAFAKRGVHDSNDCVRHRARIRLRGNNGGKGFLDFLSIAFVGTRFILGCAPLVGERAGMREVVGAPVNAPGTPIEVSMPPSASSRAYCTAITSMPAFEAKQGARYGGVPPAELLLDTQMRSPWYCFPI
jgi:hypothetical protein